MRGVVSEFRNPVMLDSMGKDSSALLLQVHHDALEVAPGERRVLAGLCVSFALLKVCPAVQAGWDVISAASSAAEIHQSRLCH